MDQFINGMPSLCTDKASKPVFEGSIYLREASDGSKTNTVVAARSIPSSVVLPKDRPPLLTDAESVSPGQISLSAHPPAH